MLIEFVTKVLASLSSKGVLAVIKRVWTRRNRITAGEVTPPLPVAALEAGRVADSEPTKFINVNNERVLNPAYVEQAIKAAPLLQHAAVAENFKGLRTGRTGKLSSVYPLSDGRFALLVRSLEWPLGGPALIAKINPADYPGLALLHEGDPISIIGSIEDVQDESRIWLGDKPDLFFE